MAGWRVDFVGVCGFDRGLRAGGDVPRQQLLDASDGMVGDAGQDLAQVGFRIQAIEFGGAD